MRSIANPESPPLRSTSIWSGWNGRNSYRDLPNAQLAVEGEDLLRERAEYIEKLAHGLLDPERSETRESIISAISVVDFDLSQVEGERSRRRRLERYGGPRGPDPRSVSMAARFDRARSLDIVETIERLTGEQFRRAGREWLTPCPFPDHMDSTPSFNANREKGVFHCWGCGRAGDLIEFCRHWFECLHRTEALDHLEDTLGLREGIA